MMKVDLVQGIHLVDQPSSCYFAAREGLDLESELFLHDWLVLEDLSCKEMGVFE